MIFPDKLKRINSLNIKKLFGGGYFIGESYQKLGLGILLQRIEIYLYVNRISKIHKKKVKKIRLI